MADACDQLVASLMAQLFGSRNSSARSLKAADRAEMRQRLGVDVKRPKKPVCALAFGPAAVAAGAIRTYEGGANFLDLGLLGAFLLATVWIWRKLGVRKPSRALAVAPADFVPPAASEPPPPRPSKPTRRAA